MLDADLAVLYGVETRVLVQAVKSYYRKLWIGGMRKAAYPFV